MVMKNKKFDKKMLKLKKYNAIELYWKLEHGEKGLSNIDFYKKDDVDMVIKNLKQQIEDLENKKNT